MGWFKKNTDPIAERERALQQEISTLESQIKRLSTRLEREEISPSPDSNGHTAEEISRSVSAQASPFSAAPICASSHPRSVNTARAAISAEPIFEELEKRSLESKLEGGESSEHYNELGVRKYDLPGLFRKLGQQFRAPSTSNPKLVNYLAAGGIQGLRPMRYEKRVARNRFIVFVIILFLILLGIVAVFVRNQ